MASTEDSPHDVHGIPSLNIADDDHQVNSSPSPDEITRILNQGASTVRPLENGGVESYHIAQLQSNLPCEDRYTHGKFKCPWNEEKEWIVWGIFDGHAGWETAELLTRRLVPFVHERLAQLAVDPETGVPSDETIDEAIKTAFEALDEKILSVESIVQDEKLSFAEKVVRLTPSYSGSCALLALYDPGTRALRVACTGDSRAVLGRKVDGKLETLTLSVDQTGKNEDEIARLKEKHPDEPDMIADGRVLGIMVSRAFGDGRFKLKKDLVDELRKKYAGLQLQAADKYLTPPYLTAEPVITTTKIEANQETFLILASDGIWDNMTNEQGTDLVARWVAWKASGQPPEMPSPETDYGTFDLATCPDGEQFQVMENKITTRDSNAGVHLIRNSLGGSHHDMISGALAFPPPHNRMIRDDMTIQVIFFN